MRETDLKPVDADTEMLEGLVVANTEKELLPAIRKQPTFKEKLTGLLDIPVDRDKMSEMLANTVDSSVIPEAPTLSDYLAGAMIMKATMGDTKAYEVIRDTIGEKPVERVEQDTIINVRMPNEYREYGE